MDTSQNEHSFVEIISKGEIRVRVSSVAEAKLALKELSGTLVKYIEYNSS